MLSGATWRCARSGLQRISLQGRHRWDLTQVLSFAGGRGIVLMVDVDRKEWRPAQAGQDEDMTENGKRIVGHHRREWLRRLPGAYTNLACALFSRQ